MSVRSYAPNGQLLSESVGIVLFNHVGSSVRGDHGRDAQYMADNLKLHVLGADRPGSGFTYPGQGARLAADYVGAVSKVASRRILPEIEAIGLDWVVVVGRSAGGLAAMATVCTDQLPAGAVHAEEPIGWHQLSIGEGAKAYNTYLAKQRAMLADSQKELIRPDPTDQVGLGRLVRAATIAANLPIDKINNRHVWRQDIARSTAFILAAHHPSVYVDILFATHSMVIGPEEIDPLQQQLRHARGKHPGRSPLSLSVVPNTVHASFDQRRFSVGLVRRTVATLLPQIEG